MHAWLGLGANLQRPELQVTEAMKRLGESQGIEILKFSSLYRTAAWGDEDQDDFINAVVKIEARLPPLDLLHVVQMIENDMGRQRSEQRWGPRLIDIDLLLYGNENLHGAELQLPHPHMHTRAFVLLPMMELDESVVIPGRGAVKELLSALDCDGVIRLDDASDH